MQGAVVFSLLFSCSSESELVSKLGVILDYSLSNLMVVAPASSQLADGNSSVSRIGDC